MKPTTKNDLSEARCILPQYAGPRYKWFAELDEFEEEARARVVCQSCPVQKLCAQTALDNREAWGTWGGMEEFRMRRALGLDEFGNDRVYSRELLCPFCLSDDLTKAKKKGAKGYPVQCNDCGIHWESYKIPDKVRKTLRRQYDTDMARSVEHAGEEGKSIQT